MTAQLLFISGPEIFIVLIVILLLFGSKKIPEVAKGLGKGMKEFKKATEDIKKEITDTDIIKDVNDIKKNLKG
jgi:sec-independent protein translocase protein TatA